MSLHSLTDQVALITGAARRVGREIARTLHGEGMNVVLHYNTSHEEAVKLCEELNDIRPVSAVIAQAPLCEMEALPLLIEKALAPWKRLDVLVNNASRFYRTPMGEVTEGAWDDLMSSNVKAPFFLSQAASAHLKKTHGSIVNITDIHAERPLRDYAAYCISKSGLLMATRVLAKELGPYVRVNAVAPGAVLWPEGENTLSEEEKQKIMASTVLKRAGSAEDIAKAVLFFVRDADFVSGQILDVDGGRTLSA